MFAGSTPLLKQYIDARFLVIRLEKLKHLGSIREFSASEAAELQECIKNYNSLKGVDNVTEKSNTALVKRVASLLQDVQNLKFEHQQTAVLAADKGRTDQLSKLWTAERAKKIRDAEVEKVEKARKAEANSEPGNIPAADAWLRYWDVKNEPHKEYFFNSQTKETVWRLPAGATWSFGNALSRNNPPSVPTTARFQSINPYLVS
jgi:hypothetical protein